MGYEFKNHPYAGRGKSILVYCTWCKKEHRMTPQPCGSCQGRGGEVLMPSDNVMEKCRAPWPECDGCEAYRDRY